jgi:hypothetical protein
MKKKKTTKMIKSKEIGNSEIEKLLKGIKFDIGKMNIKYLPPNSKKGFSLLAGINRAVKPSHVTTLVLALLTFARCIRPVVVAKINWIDGTDKLYIIDGQHLYHALIRIGMSIPYVEVEIANEQDLIEKIALANASSRSWTLGDYITAWSFIRPDYITLNQLIATHDIQARTLVSCYMPSYGKSCSNVIKSGTFKIEDKRGGDRLVKQLEDCLSICPRGSMWDIERFANAALKVMRNNKLYNHDQFIAYLKKNKSKLSLLFADQSAILNFLNLAFKK